MKPNLKHAQATPAAVSELEGRLRAINSLAEMTRATKASVPLDYVLGIGGFDLEKVEETVSARDWCQMGCEWATKGERGRSACV
jgi:G3E family GTPase